MYLSVNSVDNRNETIKKDTTHQSADLLSVSHAKLTDNIMSIHTQKPSAIYNALSDHGESKIIIAENLSLTISYKSKLDYNVHYSPTYIYIYLIMHCLAGFYFGFQMTIFNNLGRPLLQNAYGVEDYSTWLSSINLGFG